MTIEELIAELETFDPEMIVSCSVDCDIEEDQCGRRVFGVECMGVNPHFDEAVLLFDLEGANFPEPVEATKAQKQRRARRVKAGKPTEDPSKWALDDHRLTVLRGALKGDDWDLLRRNVAELHQLHQEKWERADKAEGKVQTLTDELAKLSGHSFEERVRLEEELLRERCRRKTAEQELGREVPE